MRVAFFLVKIFFSNRFFLSIIFVFLLLVPSSFTLTLANVRLPPPVVCYPLCWMWLHTFKTHLDTRTFFRAAVLNILFTLACRVCFTPAAVDIDQSTVHVLPSAALLVQIVSLSFASSPPPARSLAHVVSSEMPSIQNDSRAPAASAQTSSKAAVHSERDVFSFESEELSDQAAFENAPAFREVSREVSMAILRELDADSSNRDEGRARKRAKIMARTASSSSSGSGGMKFSVFDRLWASDIGARLLEVWCLVLGCLVSLEAHRSGSQVSVLRALLDPEEPAESSTESPAPLRQLLLRSVQSSEVLPTPHVLLCFESRLFYVA